MNWKAETSLRALASLPSVRRAVTMVFSATGVPVSEIGAGGVLTAIHPVPRCGERAGSSLDPYDLMPSLHNSGAVKVMDAIHVMPRIEADIEVKARRLLPHDGRGP